MLLPPSPANLTLTLILLLSSFATARSFSFAHLSHFINIRNRLPPSPSPSPSPFPSPESSGTLSSRSPLWNDPTPPDSKPCLHSISGCPRPGSARPPTPASRSHDISPPPRLNSGEKLGLAFLAFALALQVVLGGFLVYKRWEMRNLGVRLDKVPSSSRKGRTDDP